MPDFDGLIYDFLIAVCAILSDTVGMPNTRTPRTSSESALPLPAAESSCRNSSDSKACTGSLRASSRTARSSPRRSLRLPDWLSHATRLPRPASWECRTICRSCGDSSGRPVDLPCPPDDAVPSLPRHYGGLDATTDGSVPWRRFATVGLAFQARAFRLASPPKVPAVQRKSLNRIALPLCRTLPGP